MGADIHSYVERRILTPRRSDRIMRASERAMLQGGRREQQEHEARHKITWKHVKLLEWMPNVDHKLSWKNHYKNHDPDITPWYKDRNYGLFGILGDVRNRGGNHLNGQYRGYPEGFTGLYDFGGYHSITWYMCQELIDANIESRMPESYGVSYDVVAFVQMNKDLVAKFGCVRITLGWDS